ncbi:Hint domain-containing protein [Mameliella alba]|uniref:Type I secretion target repeat protein n=1 Tax=Mameliella alba TaxID=561184 RepID=A0A0B3S046_9RHOB|nr:Hint domain-containing protein [Mameliella alba]KHQ53717.1 Type I secretion target repeat protein [Mameliella alba]
MGSFTATYSVTYENGALAGAAVQGPFNEVLTDGEADTSFEIGDSVNAFSSGYTYVGTAVVNGKVWPVFNWDSDPTYDVVFMDEVPAGPPATYTDNGATFTGACFAPGTLIATPGGEVAVERLRSGDLVATDEGGATQVIWIGVVTRLNAVAGNALQAVCVRAGALGNGLPHSDLIVTADHGLIVDGLVVNAAALVNGDSIAFVPMSQLPERVTYYHIETAAHDVILANGTPAETFVDAVARSQFDNFQEYLDLYGAERIIPEMNRPRVSSRRLLPAEIRDRLDRTIEATRLTA